MVGSETLRKEAGYNTKLTEDRTPAVMADIRFPLDENKCRALIFRPTQTGMPEKYICTISVLSSITVGIDCTLAIIRRLLGEGEVEVE